VELRYWHLAVVVALTALIVWGVRVARRTTVVVSAAILMVLSGWLFYTLVVDEAYLESDLNSRLDVVGLIGVPAALGVGLIVLAVRRTRR
jgi:hypothetical protein